MQILLNNFSSQSNYGLSFHAKSPKTINSVLKRFDKRIANPNCHLKDANTMRFILEKLFAILNISKFVFNSFLKSGESIPSKLEQIRQSTFSPTIFNR